MGQVNIYKIDNNKKEQFYKDMYSKLELQDTVEINKVVNEENIEFGMTLYISKPAEEKDVSWNWLLKEFNVEEVKNSTNPKSVLLIEKGDTAYAVTFGAAYFIVDKYCDRQFAFNFARKVQYKEIKTTALTAPNLKRNKIINTYINYNDLEFDSGESFTKVKAKLEIEEDFDLYKETIEIGNSIKFTLNNNSLENIAELILHIENILESQEDKYKIPVFAKVMDADLIKTLDERLKEEIRKNIDSINISEVDIIGSTEIFNHNDTQFTINFNRKKEDVSELSIEQIKKFAKKYGINLNESLLDIRVIRYNNGASVKTEYLKNLIDYTDDDERCILLNGQWYHFNDDYLEYLSDSIREIDAIYNPDYDLRKSLHNQFIDRKYLEEKDNDEYQGKIEKEIREKLKKKYYKERYYNIMLSEEHGFENYDRVETRIGTADIELMDLYKDKTMFAVKIGSSSGKLCYVVDQSIQALKLYKHKLGGEKPELKDVAILLVLERAKKLKLVDGKPDINELDMLLLKNKLDSWKKEVRVLGYNPVIYVNYVINDL
ncbi:TIGR04141 family sporadically distributed protein [Clostridium perfringens]|nr:TIGR04141 family sporadically distributed protein [Clostridium perfringens]MDM0457652.1 TIGR04141 family sporadically distributed protein [Clostridium perfringens]